MNWWMPHILNLVALLFIVNPLNGAVLFIDVTSRYNARRKAQTALTAAIWTAAVLVFFMLTGKFVFSLFGVTLSAFQIAGGILIFGAARVMTRAETPPEKTSPAETESARKQSDVAIVPLAIPMLAGPGAISTIILQAGEMKHFAVDFPMLVLNVLIVSTIVYFLLRESKWLLRILGSNVIRVITRIMGLVIMAIGIQFILNGTSSFLLDLTNKGILLIPGH